MATTEQKIEDNTPEIEAMRALHQVKLVEEAQEGTGIADLPNGRYGFTWAPQSESPLFRKQGYQSFEIHKAATGEIHIMGFITAEDSSRLATSNEEFYINLYPAAYENASKVVAINKSQIVQHRDPSREAGNSVKLKLEPARESVQ